MTPETAVQTTQAQAQPVQRNEVMVQDPLSLIVSGDMRLRDELIIQRAKLDYSQRLAKMFAYSGCFADVKDQREDVSIAKALVKIKLGESMGFSEAEAMTGIDIIQGRVAVGASLRAARMQRAGYSWPNMICTDEGCWVPLVFQGQPMMQQKVNAQGEIELNKDGSPVMVQVVVSFTLRDAQKAGLAGKDNYKKDPSSMYFARAITRAQLRYGPGVLGVDILDTYEAGEIIDAAPVMTRDGREPVHEHDDRLEAKMAAQAAEAEVAAQEAAARTAETKQDTPKADGPYVPRWKDEAEMKAALNDLRTATADDEIFFGVFSQHNITGDEDVKLDSPAVGAAFDAITAALAKKNAPAPAGKTLQFGKPKGK